MPDRFSEPAVDEETLDLPAAARLLHIGLDSMKELVDTGEVPATRLNRKHTVLLRSDLLAYLREEGRRQAEERRMQARGTKPKVTVPAKAGRPAAAKPDLSAYGG